MRKFVKIETLIFLLAGQIFIQATIAATPIKLTDFLTLNPKSIVFSNPKTFPYTGVEYKRWDKTPETHVKGSKDFYTSSFQLKEGPAKLNIVLQNTGGTLITLYILKLNKGYGCKRVMGDLTKANGQTPLNYYDVVNWGSIMPDLISAEMSFERSDWRISFDCAEISAPNISDEDRTATLVTISSGSKEYVKKTMKRNLIKCDTTGKWIKGIRDAEEELKTFFFYIDTDDKRLLEKDMSPVLGDIKEFSDQKIVISEDNDSDNITSKLKIDRITGEMVYDVFKRTTEEQRRVLGFDIGNKQYQGFCASFEETQKF